MSKYLLMLWMLICFIPKADWDKLGDKQALFLKAMAEIYHQKHKVDKAIVTISETSNGFIRIEIDQPKQEV